ncbi:MAG TPA: type III secretion system export apparatus subunit SctT [Magnetospirillum sp.]|nr:type III secretion system export apparatus subunit SctT [Magnetospirillum sp.]
MATGVGALVDIEPLRVFVFSFAYATPRILGMFTVLPFTSRQTLPGLLRAGLSISMALMVVPTVAPLAGDTSVGGVEMVALILKETLIGVILGYVVAILFWGAEALGFFIDNQRGATMSSSMNPFTGVSTSPLGMLFNQGLTAFFFAAGGFSMLMGGVYGTYALWPVASFWPVFHVEDTSFFLAQLDHLMYVAVVMAAPPILAMFLSELGLAFVSRFAPQLQVFFLAMPIKSAVALLVLAVYVPFLMDYLWPEIVAASDLATAMRRLFP